MKKWVEIVAAGLTIIGFLIFVVASLWIGSDVRKLCRDNKKIYSGDCVTVFSEMAVDAGLPFRDRNQAIWALGQMGDPRGLTYLNKYYTGVIPDNENPNKALSQYEISKAMKLMQGGFNISALIWRHGME